MSRFSVGGSMSGLNVDDGKNCSGTSWLFVRSTRGSKPFRLLYIELQRYKRGPLRVNGVAASGAPSGGGARSGLVWWEANIGLRWETSLGSKRVSLKRRDWLYLHLFLISLFYFWKLYSLLKWTTVLKTQLLFLCLKEFSKQNYSKKYRSWKC